MESKHDAGFSLIEVLVASVILAAIVIPTCSSLVLSHKMNAKTEELMQAQLDVSSAVETLMAEGIEASDVNWKDITIDANNNEIERAEGILIDNRFQGITVIVEQLEGEPYYYMITVSGAEEVSVTTAVRMVGEPKVGGLVNG